MLLTAALAVLAVARCPADSGYAQQPSAVQLNLPVSVRQLGMGWVAPGGSDVLRSWSNPAFLVDGDYQAEVALVGGLVLEDTTQFGIGGGWRLARDLSMGVTLVRYGFSIDEVDQYGDSTGAKAEQAVMGGSVVLAGRADFLCVGLGVRGVRETILESSETTAGADVGLAMLFGGLSLSAAIRNVNVIPRENEQWTGIPDYRLPMELRFGVGCRVDALRLRLAAEYFKTVEREGRIGMGVEYWPTASVGVRAGGIGTAPSSQTTAGPEALYQATAGLSVLVAKLGLDYAVALHSSGMNHRVALSCGFGAVGPAAQRSVAVPPPPAEPAKAVVPAPVAAKAVVPAPVATPPRPAVSAAPAPAAVVAAPAAPVAQAASGESRLLNLAVADLRAENVSAGDSAVIADLLRSELVRTTKFNVVEKQNMERVLAEHAFQRTGCTTEECAVKLGKLLNVQRMVVGSFGKLLDSYLLSIRVVDVETGRVVHGDSVEGTTVKELKAGVREIAGRMADQVK